MGSIGDVKLSLSEIIVQPGGVSSELLGSKQYASEPYRTIDLAANALYKSKGGYALAKKMRSDNGQGVITSVGRLSGIHPAQVRSIPGGGPLQPSGKLRSRVITSCWGIDSSALGGGFMSKSEDT